MGSYTSFVQHFRMLFLKVFTYFVANSKLSYFSAYLINLCVTYLYLIAYHFLGIRRYLAIREHAGYNLNAYNLLIRTICLSVILPFLISWIIYAVFIRRDDTYCRIGFIRGFLIALLNALIIVPILFIMAFLNACMPAH